MIIESLLGLAPILGPLAGTASGIRFVREGERGLLLRFDRAVQRGGRYRVVNPGFRMIIPVAHKLAKIHVRQRTVNYPAQAITLADMTVFHVGAVLLGRVKDSPEDIYRALFEPTDLDDALTDYGLLVIREALANATYQDLIGEGRARIAAELHGRMQAQADHWGFEVLKFELSDCKPSDDTSRLIQMSTQARFRLDALNAAAEGLGVPVGRLNPNLAAVLVGTPLVATAAPVVVEKGGEASVGDVSLSVFGGGSR